MAAVIEGSGNAIDSIYYENLDDSPSKELIVDWGDSGAEALPGGLLHRPL